MNKPVILTGLRANNDLHIGNYLGGLLPIVDIAHQKAGEFQVNLFVPDLHSFTTPTDHSQLQEAIMNNLRVYVAAGFPLDNPDVYIYRQSYIPAHSELAWILDCFTGFGELSRMTEFKDKASRLGIDHIGVGQFNYPPLMAADILLYGAKYVPVGEDQRQHIEFTRMIAERMNKRFGELFVVPKSMTETHEFFGKDQGLRIKDLADPSKKMSKSEDNRKGVIFMTDIADEARKKIMSANTDSLGSIAYDAERQAGVTNLIELLGLFSNRTAVEVAQEYAGQEQYGPLKTTLADAVGDYLTVFQTKLSDVDDQRIFEKLEASEKQMNEQANKVLHRVQQAVGLRS